jgi:hypothetical protein
VVKSRSFAWRRFRLLASLLYRKSPVEWLLTVSTLVSTSSVFSSRCRLVSLAMYSLSLLHMPLICKNNFLGFVGECRALRRPYARVVGDA